MSQSIDVETIRARASADLAVAARRRFPDEDTPLSGAGPLLRSGFVVGLDEGRADVPALCDALEHERKVAAAWKDLAVATGHTLLRGLKGEHMGHEEIEAAGRALIALGIDPEAP